VGQGPNGEACGGADSGDGVAASSRRKPRQAAFLPSERRKAVHQHGVGCPWLIWGSVDSRCCLRTQHDCRALAGESEEKLVGAVRFELTTSCTPSKRAYQATLRPDRANPCGQASRILSAPNLNSTSFTGRPGASRRTLPQPDPQQRSVHRQHTQLEVAIRHPVAVVLEQDVPVGPLAKAGDALVLAQGDQHLVLR
jgi:hypothetical protein